MNSSSCFQRLKSALCATGVALCAVAFQASAQSSDALINKLVSKGILTEQEAKDLRAETDKDFKSAVQAKTGMPAWVNSYKIGGDFRGRFDQYTGENTALIDRARLRYRARLGFTANMLDAIEIGFRLGSGDSSGNPVSNSTTMENNFSKKPVWMDAAYARWTIVNSSEWLVSATLGKMDNPFVFTPMVFTGDITPEGIAIQARQTFNNGHSISLNNGIFVMDDAIGSTQDPMMYGSQIFWNAKWTPKWSSSLGFGALGIANPEQLTTNAVPFINQGNTRNSSGVLMNNFFPLIADASASYNLDKFPLYNGPFPVKLACEFIHNPGANKNNNGYWLGVTFGKSGKKRTWDITYRYEHLEADATYDQFVDDSVGAYYKNAPAGGKTGYYTGTNVKGHMIKLNYSLTDALILGFSGYITELILPTHPSKLGEPRNRSFRAQVELLWKF